MRLSEAIRLGAALRPQAYFALFDGVGTCAFGAAFEANGWAPVRWSTGWNHADPEWRRPTNLTAVHPVTQGVRLVKYIIISLNNVHRWTRERIADWVEGEERRLGLWDVPAEVVEAAEACA